MRDYFSDAEGQYLAEDLQHAAYGMRLAGGSPLYRPGKRYAASWHPVAGNATDDSAIFRKLRRRLLPGFALVQRHSYLDDGDDFSIADFYILPEYRKGGLGQRAIDDILETFRGPWQFKWHPGNALAGVSSNAADWMRLTTSCFTSL